VPPLRNFFFVFSLKRKISGVVSFLLGFRYSCLIASQCSFWVAFGVFVARIFFETACFSAFLLIAHGYCIMHEQLSVRDRRSIAALGSLLYLILTGYKSAVPQFSVSGKKNHKSKNIYQKFILMLIFFCKIPSCFSNSYPNRFIPNTKNHLCKV